MFDLIRNSIVYIAIFISKSQEYKNIKDLWRDILINSESKYRKIVDYSMIFLVIVSIILLVYDSENRLDQNLQILEDLILSIFLVEYLARVWIYKDIHKIVLHHHEKNLFLQKKINLRKLFKDIFLLKWEYIKTPLAIIDLLAILPNLRVLRFLRVFMIFRLFKLFRYTKSINKFLTIIDDKKFELFALIMLFSFVILLSSVAMYVFEVKQNGNINSLFDAVYWSYVTIASLGYGDISPISAEGRVLTLFLILSGIAFIAFATSIITSAFSDKINEIREDKLKNKIEKLERNTVIFGLNPISQKLYFQLINHGDDAVIICENRLENEKALSLNIISIFGDPNSLDFLKSIGINKNAERVVTLFETDSKNLNVTLSIRSLNRRIDIISIIETKKSKRKFFLAGSTTTLYPYDLFSRMVMTYIKYPNVFKSMEAIVFANSSIFIEEVAVSKNTFLKGKMNSQIEFRKFKFLLFGVLRDKEFIFKPKKEFIFEDGDFLIIFGDRVSLNYFK